MIHKEYEYVKMAEVEDDLWWYRCLHGLVRMSIEKHFKDSDIKIVDAGCGTGGMMRYLSDRGYRKIQGFDISEHAIRICSASGLDVFRDDIGKFALHFPPESLNVIICNDIFCYLDEKERRDRINDFASSLRSGGIVLMNLPAYDFFGGIHDLAVGIKHRFNRNDVAGMFDGGMFHVKSILWPCAISPLIYVVRLFQRLELRYKKNVIVRSDIDMPPKWINELLFAIVSAENRLFPWRPLGSSLYVVAQKN